MLSEILSQQPTKAHIFYGLYSASLISLGQLCDNGCIAILDNNYINILKFPKLISKEHQNQLDGIWYILITNTIQHRAHAIITIDKINTEVIQYLQLF